MDRQILGICYEKKKTKPQKYVQKLQNIYIGMADICNILHVMM